MNAESFEDVERRAAGAMELEAKTLEAALSARRHVHEAIEMKIAEGDAYVLTDEEVRLMRSFRRFKATCKPGAVFRWQTRPVDAAILEPPNTVLVRDPQEVS